MIKSVEINKSDGYFDTNDVINRSEGSIISPSSNVFYTRDRRLTSLKNIRAVLDNGGSKAFVLDDDLLGFLGVTSATPAQGNIIQGVGRNLYFVGNDITNGVKVNVPSTNTETVIGDLDDIPQFAKYNGSGWDTPLQLGLAPQETTAELTLTDSTSIGGDFTGIIQGSISLRLARKRFGSVSIASAPSNVVTGENNSVIATIPAFADDGSDEGDREWYLYFTYTGFGSQSSHLLFPITIPETELSGTDVATIHIFGNAKAKVISQHASDQSQRQIEIEFYNNDLLLLAPFEDYYPAESCRFIFQLGNVMCLVGTGEDGLGFDVSKPDNYEAYSPDDRQWMSELPVAIIQAENEGFVWIITAHQVYQAVWTGATAETPPVVLRMITSNFGAIGERAICSVYGSLFFLSKGKTPIAISPDGEINKEFGRRVRSAFTSYDEDAFLAYDESTNSVSWFNGNSSIAYQIDNDIWGAPCTVTTNGTDPLEIAFAFDGSLYVCYYDSVALIPDYVTSQYNDGGNLSWNWTTSFLSGGSLNLKDLIEGLAIVQSPQSSYTITIKAYKDFVTSAPSTQFTITGTSTNPLITHRTYIESLDYKTFAVRAEGTNGGETVDYLALMIQEHSIETR